MKRIEQIIENLKVIENELVPVYETSTGEKVVYGTELYETLQSKRQYTDWMKSRLVECDAKENEDYDSFSQKSEKPQGGRPVTEYIIKLDTAKEMAMLERNDKGKAIRRYFIGVEKKFKKKLSAIEQLKLHQDAILEVNEKVDSVQHNVDSIQQNLDDFKKDLPLLGIECQRITRAKNCKIVPLLGGKNAPAYKSASLRGKVYGDVQREICRQFGVESYKEIKRCKIDKALEIIADYQLPFALQQEVADMNAQMHFA